MTETKATLDGALGHVTLAPADAELGMGPQAREHIARRLRAWARDPQVYAVAWQSRSNTTWSVGHRDDDGRATGVASGATDADPARDRHAFTWLLECFSKPTAALLTTEVRSSGHALFAYATHRIAVPTLRMSFDQVTAGRMIDCGLTWILARLPSNTGLYLALTGQAIGAADALATGLITHVIEGDRMGEIMAELTDASPIDAVLDAMAMHPEPSLLSNNLAGIAHCFAAPTLEEIEARLSARADDGERWATQACEALAKHDRALMALTFRALRQARTLDLRETLVRDARVARRWKELSATAARGSEKVDATAMADDVFAGRPGEDLPLPQRSQMQDWRAVPDQVTSRKASDRLA